MVSILLVEDDKAQRQALEEFLSGLERGARKINVYSAPDGELAISVFNGRKIDLVICDLILPDTTGILLLKKIREKNNSVPFLILTAQPSIESAVEAIKLGASDYLQKPIDLVLLKNKVHQLLENIQLKSENKNLRARISETFGEKNIVGNSPAFLGILEKAKQIAPTDVTVLIEGESGTGKELIANLIHENSNRAKQSFIKVNCGALTKTLLESELFGVIRGAYTGADQDRPGYFEAATGGTIFLDEIGEMDPESQIRLLRVIEEREVTRVGANKSIKVDVRIIAATNRKLTSEVEEGKFREDLFYRLAVIRFDLPPLRERIEDIPLLFNYYITALNDKYEKSVTGMTPELLKFFQTYGWPGNIRQLRNILEGMVLLAKDDILSLEDIPDDLKKPPSEGSIKKILTSITAGVPFNDYEKAIIRKNLSFNGGNREKTANMLGISERTLYRKIKEYNI